MNPNSVRYRTPSSYRSNTFRKDVSDFDMDKLRELINKAHSRRSFIAGAGALGATAVIVGCGGSSPKPAPPPTPTPGITDADILNFALNLEYLEAEFYLRAATGQGLSTADAGSGAGTVTGGSMVSFPTPTLQQYAFEIAQDELNDVRFLRQALASAAVSRPTIHLSNSFNGLATAAGIGSTFNPFADSNSFWWEPSFSNTLASPRTMAPPPF